MTRDEMVDALENLLDNTDLASLLYALATVCSARAYTFHGTGDDSLEKDWLDATRNVNKAADNIAMRTRL